MATKSTIEWTESTWNPVTGCTKISPGCAHCLDPDALVLYADLTWRRLGDVQVGDVLVGFDEYVQNESGRGMRALHPSTVTSVWRTRQMAMRITTNEGEIICSGDHRFLSHKSHQWIYARNFILGTQLRFIGCRSSSTDSDDYAAGYLMGMTDGDGTWRFLPGQRSDKRGFPQCYWRVALTDEDGLIATQRHLARFGLVANIRPFVSNNGHGYYKKMQRLELRSIPDLTLLDKVLEYRENADYGRGYLAGIFDAEGSFSGANLRISNKNLSYLEHVVNYGALIDLDFRVEPKRPEETLNARLYGPRHDRLAFFTLVQPAIRRKTRALFDACLDTKPAKVIRLESIGERELIDIETTTHTFYANGLATHNCYAERIAERFRGLKAFPNGFEITLHPERLDELLRWKKPRRIFVNSMSDLFHERVPFEFIQQVFDIMRRAPQHQFQVLTKRAERLEELHEYLPWPGNVWMGVSVENENYLFRIDHLRRTQAQIKFLSLEPLLGPLPKLNLRGIDWVIVGGESGPGARPMRFDWVIEIRDQCLAANVPFFFKQWGGVRKKKTGRVLEGRTWDQFPISVSGTVANG